MPTIRNAPQTQRRRPRMGPATTIAAFGLAIATASLPSPSPAEPLEIPLEAPGQAGWKPLVFRSIDRHTTFEATTDPEGRPAYRASSACGASAMTVALPTGVDPVATPRLAWRWRVERGIDVAREKTQAGDDFAARVYVLFPFDSDRASVFERMQRSLGSRLFGVEMPGRTLNYVWASRVPVGSSWVSPHHADARLVALESRSAEGADDLGWRDAIVDWAADAHRLFPPSGPATRRETPYALGIMVDSDAVCGEATAWFSDFRLLGPAQPTQSLQPAQPAHSKTRAESAQSALPAKTVKPKNP